MQPPASTDFVLSFQGFNNVLIRARSLELFPRDEWVNEFDRRVASAIPCSRRCSRMEQQQRRRRSCTLLSAPAPAQVHYTAPWIKFNFIAHCWIQLYCTVLLNWAGCHPLHFCAESTPVLENVFALPRWVSPKNRTCHGHVGTFPVSTIALFLISITWLILHCVLHMYYQVFRF